MTGAVRSFEDRFMDDLKSLKTPISNIINSLTKDLDAKRTKINELVVKLVRHTNTVFTEAISYLDTLPKEISRSLTDYISAINVRPKGIFLLYDYEAILATIKAMLSRTKKAAIIIAPAIDEPMLEILNSLRSNILVELYCRTKISDLPANVSLIKRKNIPQRVYIIARDEKEALWIVENKEKRYIGILLEDIPIESLIRLFAGQR